MSEIIIQSAFGKLKGIKTESCCIYHNIPFAITERFEKPQPVEKWDGVLECDGNVTNCYQRFAYADEAFEARFYYKEFDYMRESDFNESPMTLNIITPLKTGNNPVIIYVHGGSFENGCNNDMPFRDSQEYAKRGITLVSIGYRLNVFGLYDSVNYGLMDIIAAIKWVKNNIKDFGGNPDNITIMGQSAGAMAIQDLLLNKEMESLVKGAILMSGAGLIPYLFGPRTKEYNKEYWDLVRKEADCQNDNQLKNCNPEKLWRSWWKIAHEENKAGFHGLAPSIDGYTIKDKPQKIVRKKEDANIPMIVGVTSQDMFPYMIFDLARKIAKKHYRHEYKPVYCYYFDHSLPGNTFKAFHSIDLWFAFGNMQYCWRKPTEYDYKLSKLMIDYFANFAKNQNPNAKDIPTWQPIGKNNKKFRLFAEEDSKAYIGNWKCRLKLWHSFLFDKGPI